MAAVSFIDCPNLIKRIIHLREQSKGIQRLPCIQWGICAVSSENGPNLASRRKQGEYNVEPWRNLGEPWRKRVMLQNITSPPQKGA